ncbi:hypothetical protein D3C71_1185030 [compost metagenome]
MEIDLIQGVTQLAEQAFHLGMAGRRFAEAGVGRGGGRGIGRAENGHAHFIGQHLDGGGQVQ